MKQNKPVRANVYAQAIELSSHLPMGPRVPCVVEMRRAGDSIEIRPVEELQVPTDRGGHAAIWFYEDETSDAPIITLPAPLFPSPRIGG